MGNICPIIFPYLLNVAYLISGRLIGESTLKTDVGRWPKSIDLQLVLLLGTCGSTCVSSMRSPGAASSALHTRHVGCIDQVDYEMMAGPTRPSIWSGQVVFPCQWSEPCLIRREILIDWQCFGFCAFGMSFPPLTRQCPRTALEVNICV